MVFWGFYKKRRSAGSDTGPPGVVREAALSIIAADMRVEGRLDSPGAVRIEGTVVGNVQVEGHVVLAKGGVVEGEIRTREAIVGGEARGSIVANERVELQASAAIHGDIATPRLAVHEGAALDGELRMAQPNAVSPRAGSRQRASRRSARAGRFG